MLSNKKLRELEKIAKQIKIDIVQMSYTAKSAHTGGSLSSVEILIALYFEIMKSNPKNPMDPTRDRLVFSKGHDSKALYAVLCEKNFFPKSQLWTHEKNSGSLPGHPIRISIPGVEVSTGSLGHGLSVAVGMAYAAKLDQKKHKVFTILSDGECDEGSTWEAILFAGHHKLDNLIAIVDYNKIQSFGYTKDVLDLEPFAQKFESFNWLVKEVNGHDLRDLVGAMSVKPVNRPLAIIAHTIKGYQGPSQHVNQISSHYKPPSIDELEEVTKRLKK